MAQTTGITACSAVDQTSVYVAGYYDNGGEGYQMQYKFEYGAGSFGSSTSMNYSYDGGNSWDESVGSLTPDTQYQWRTYTYWTKPGEGIVRSGTSYAKTHAYSCTGTPSHTSVTDTTATIRCTSAASNPYFIMTVQSSGSVWLEYKKSSDPTWTTAGAVDTGVSGTGPKDISRNLTGLSGSTTYQYRLQITRNTENATTYTSATQSFTTNPSAPTITTNAATGKTHEAATLNATVDPNTISTTVKFRYGTDPTLASYTEVEASTNPWTGDGDQYPSKAISGLTYSTTYYFKAMAYGSFTGSPLSGSILNFTTDPAPYPSITTGSYSSVTHNAATIYGTVNPQGFSTYAYFQYVDDTQYLIDAWASATNTAEQFIDTPGVNNYQAALSGLDASTTYHYRAAARYNSTSYVYGDGATFATSATPEVVAAEEEHMQTIQFDGQYGVAKTVTFTLRDPSSASSDLFYDSTAPVQADCLVFKDGVYDNTSDNAPAQVFTSPPSTGPTALYTLEVSATEMQADVVDVWIRDAVGSAFRDAHIQIRTSMNLSNIALDASNCSDNRDAFKLTPDGTGKPLNAVGTVAVSGNITATDLTLSGDFNVGDDIVVTDAVTVGGNFAITGILSAASISGVLSSMVLRSGTLQAGGAGSATLDASANANNDYYNNAVLVITSGSGAGQARTITDYNGTTKVCTVAAWTVNPSTDGYMILPGQDFWSAVPAAELSAVPSYPSTATMQQLIQFLYQRFAFKRYQDATEQIMYKADSSTPLATATFTDNASDQTIGKSAT